MLHQLTALKTLLIQDAQDTADDERLVTVSEIVQSILETHCNRKFARSSDTHEFPGNARSLFPARFPVETIALWEIQSPDDHLWYPMVAPAYTVRAGGRYIELDAQISGPSALCRFTHTGGYQLPDEEPITGAAALPAHISNASLLQSRALFPNLDKLKFGSVSGGGVSYTINPGLLIPEVVALLSSERRILL